jgi:hypothetical protein
MESIYLCHRENRNPWSSQFCFLVFEFSLIQTFLEHLLGVRHEVRHGIHVIVSQTSMTLALREFVVLWERETRWDISVVVVGVVLRLTRVLWVLQSTYK